VENQKSEVQEEKRKEGKHKREIDEQRDEEANVEEK